MTFVDRWPSTPMKQFTGWCAFVAFFLFSLAALWWMRDIKMELWYGLAALVLGYNGDGTLQFFSKRKTQYPEPTPVTAEAGATVNVEAVQVSPAVEPPNAIHVERTSAATARDMTRGERGDE